jgi:hypothetical protein
LQACTTKRLKWIWYTVSAKNFNTR